MDKLGRVQGAGVFGHLLPSLLKPQAGAEPFPGFLKVLDFGRFAQRLIVYFFSWRQAGHVDKKFRQGAGADLGIAAGPGQTLVFVLLVLNHSVCDFQVFLVGRPAVSPVSALRGATERSERSARQVSGRARARFPRVYCGRGRPRRRWN